MAEASFRQSMLLSQGSLAIFFSNPLVAGLVTLALGMLLWPAFSTLKSTLRRQAPTPQLSAP
jgi:putative tricarboxylic transport membrane protein